MASVSVSTVSISASTSGPKRVSADQTHVFCMLQLVKVLLHDKAHAAMPQNDATGPTKSAEPIPGWFLKCTMLKYVCLIQLNPVNFESGSTLADQK